MADVGWWQNDEDQRFASEVIGRAEAGVAASPVDAVLRGADSRERSADRQVRY